MPEELEEMPNSGRPNRKYPWGEWLDGNPRMFVQGEDYDCKTESFRNTAHSAAKRMGGKIKIHYPEGRDGDRVAIKFVEVDDE